MTSPLTLFIVKGQVPGKFFRLYVRCLPRGLLTHGSVTFHQFRLAFDFQRLIHPCGDALDFPLFPHGRFSDPGDAKGLPKPKVDFPLNR